MLNQITLACFSQGHQNKFINSETWAVSELYCSFLKDYKTGKVKKCNINIRDGWGNLLDYYEKYTDVITIRLHFDFVNYSTLNNKQKKLEQLKSIHKGMMKIADKENWETNSLLDAYNKCLDNNLIFSFNINKPKLSPNKKNKVTLSCIWDINSFKVYANILDKKNETISKKEIISKKPQDGEFIYYIKWKWLDNSNIFIQDKYKYGNNESWKINLGINRFQSINT